MKEIHPRSSINSVVRIPGSKSITHRALIIASLAQKESLLDGFLSSEDTLHTINALRELGVEISIEEEHVKVMGRGGNFSPVSDRKEIFLGNSGTSYRLLLSVVALARGEYVLTGTERMYERPIGDLVQSINRLGVEATCIERDGYPPVLVRGKGISGGKVSIPGDQSSQFISSLLLAGPYAANDLEIEIKGKLISGPYVDLTIAIMDQFGVSVFRDGYNYFKVPTGQGYKSRKFTIEGDVSSASYFWAAAAVTGGTITTENIHSLTTKQGDIALLDILEKMGCTVNREADRVVVKGRVLKGIEVDMGAMPDMVPTLAAIALFADGKTHIKNISHLRYKESDRLKAIAFEWRRIGGQVEELDDGIIIHGGKRLLGAVIDPHNDHRIAMSLAVAGLKTPRIRINNDDCVNKSFPGFWELWDRL
jgi:3-phosphoshikimate 1-carboxyvinyltransferase